MAGVANAGKVGTTYYPQGGSAPVFSTPNLSGIDKVYENQYNTAEAGILKAHGIPSPSLIAGLNVRPSGFASPADELEWAKTELETKIIKPLREEFFEDFEALFIEIGLTPDNLTFDEVKEEEVRPEDIAEPTAMSEKKSVDDFDDKSMLDSLSGETIDFNEWELVDVREANGEDIEDWANSLIEEKKTNLTKLVDFITSKPNGFSTLDKSYYKVRYTYQEKYSSGNSREFCKKMMGRTSNGVVYRLEDIDKATRDGVNRSFGHKGQSYDLFKYKGGKQCGHYWQEELYRMKDKTEKLISRGEEVNSIPNSYAPRPRGNEESKIAPKDMPNGGAYPK